jgi:hypothetical protein
MVIGRYRKYQTACLYCLRMAVRKATTGRVTLRRLRDLSMIHSILITKDAMNCVLVGSDRMKYICNERYTENTVGNIEYFC